MILWESFRKNVFEKRVRPVPGSVLRYDLAGGIKFLGGFAGSICHTGIYLGNDKILASQGYASKRNRIAGIESVKANAAVAAVSEIV